MIALHICGSPPDVLRRPSSACSGGMPHFGGGPFPLPECLLRQGESTDVHRASTIVSAPDRAEATL